MTDDRQSDEPKAAPPLPVRPSAAAAPTPVRSLLGAEEAVRDDAEHAAPPPAPPELVLERDGVTWLVRVTGRSLGGPREAPVPFVHLSFSPEDPEGAGGGQVREALVAGGASTDFSDAWLEEAFRVSQLRRPPDAPPRPFFAEIASKGNRHDG